ncbi:MAG: AAA family ATPase [Desulfobacterales bacterium]
MKFPYGICDFRKITTKNYFYCDRTDRIPLLERGEYLLFLRPRRFGKSLLLSMLANYYDVAKKHEFAAMFGKLKIGKNPTELRNSYFILKWDFSCVDPTGTAEDIKRGLWNHINSRIKGFMRYYENFNLHGIEVNPDDVLVSIDSLISAVRMTDHPIYLLIDEYDNFANQVMMGIQRNRQELYKALVHEAGPLRTLFKAVKASASESLFDRIFITGVSPVVMSDITSGYNIAENIYLRHQFNDICGFSENEIGEALERVSQECGLSENSVGEALELMKTYYNGYRFSSKADKFVYNPTLSTYFLKYLHEDCEYPRKMLDSNLATDDAKLDYIAQVSAGRQMLLELLREDRTVSVSDISDRFGIREMLKEERKNDAFMASFLYYFGVLTMKGEEPDGRLTLKIPNLVIRGLYAERICEMLLPEPALRDKGKYAAEKLYQKGDMRPLCDFVENHYFRVFGNRDYRWANELTVKTAFLTLLYNDILYIMDTESETDRRYADLTMIIRPDMRRFTILDILIEFKFVTLKDAGMSGEQARKLSAEELRNLSLMQAQMEEAKKQVKAYGDVLDRRFGNLRLHKYAVVSLGFERICWEEVL